MIRCHKLCGSFTLPAAPSNDQVFPHFLYNPWPLMSTDGSTPLPGVATDNRSSNNHEI